MFDFLKGRKKHAASFNPLQEIQKLAELGPPATLLAVIRDKDSEPEDISPVRPSFCAGKRSSIARGATSI